LLANLDLLEPYVSVEDEPLRAGLARVRTLARRALDETRALSHDLRPTILDDVGLCAAVEWLAAEYERTYGGAASFHADPRLEGALSGEQEVALFRIAQEALTNSGKHAGARNVRVSLSCSDSSVKLVIEDDGRGFDLDHVAGPTREGRLGLYGMRERAGLLGGRLQIHTDPGRGTRIVAEIPRSKRGSTRPAVLEGPRGAGRRYEVAPRVGASV
jgi:signal transduction histidine kinase